MTRDKLLSVQMGTMSKRAFLRTLIADVKTASKELEEAWDKKTDRPLQLAGERLETVVEGIKEILK